MPGPRNAKSRRKVQAKKGKRAKSARSSPGIASPAPQAGSPAAPPAKDASLLGSHEELIEVVGSLDLTDLASTQRTPLPPDTYPGPQVITRPYLSSPFDNALVPEDSLHHSNDTSVPVLLLKRPFIEDPGTGIRVRDTRQFLASRFATPPSLDDELCAEFAQEEVLQMLCSVLPQETALASPPLLVALLPIVNN